MAADGDENAAMTETLAIDGAANLVVSELMGLGFDPTVTGGLLLADYAYEQALKEWTRKNYGGVGAALEDSMARDVVIKSIWTSVVMWATSRVAGGDLGAVSAIINSAATYTTSRGIQELLNIAQ